MVLRINSIVIRTESIRLDQFLKWAEVVVTGGEAKSLITRGHVKVNGVPENRRGRSLVPGDQVAVQVPGKTGLFLNVLREG
ncbi:hypothetical protein SY88_07640 [Clostridiales bacterium PH28_bin88]|nr:hypothetical protein SY88_07640 [Clostridiales bacterium PH28_bin88]